jgi:hypothetical protein
MGKLFPLALLALCLANRAQENLVVPLLQQRTLFTNASISGPGGVDLFDSAMDQAANFDFFVSSISAAVSVPLPRTNAFAFTSPSMLSRIESDRITADCGAFAIIDVPMAYDATTYCYTTAFVLFRLSADVTFSFNGSVSFGEVRLLGEEEVIFEHSGEGQATYATGGTLEAGIYSIFGAGIAEETENGIYTPMFTYDFEVLPFSNRTVIDFETDGISAVSLANGLEIEALDYAGLVTISGFSNSGLSPALFDSTPDGPNMESADPDLLVGLGNVLIAQDRALQSVPGIYDFPGDDRSGGSFQFFFQQRSRANSIDLIDVCPSDGLAATVELHSSMGFTRTYFVPAGWTADVAVNGPPGYGTLDLATLSDQPGFAATATAVEHPDFEADDLVCVTVTLSGSGAVDNLDFEVGRSLGAFHGTQVPRRLR